MSTIRHYLNNSFPQPILDVDVSSINTSDANNYLFDYSQITADDTFEIIEATVDSIKIKVLSKDFDGFTLPVTDTYKACKKDPVFLFSDSSKFPTDPYYTDGYLEADDGTRKQVYGGCGATTLPKGKTSFKYLCVPSDPAWDPTGSYVYHKQFPICDENSKINLPSNYASFDSPDIRVKPDSGFSVICVFKDINSSDVSLFAPEIQGSSNIVNVSERSTLIEISDGGVSTVASFGSYNSVPNSGVLIYNSKEWSTISSNGTLNKGSSESDNTLVSFNPKYDLNCVSRFILWNRDVSIDELKDYYSKYVIPLPAVHYDISKQYHDTTHTYGYARNQLIDLSGNGVTSQLVTDSQVKDPVQVYDTWSIIGNRCEATEVSPSVWHVTKLIPNSNPASRILFLCPVANAPMFGNKFSIYISCPSGKTFTTEGAFRCSEGTADGIQIFKKKIEEGINKIDLTNYPARTDDNLSFYFEIPRGFYDVDENGNIIETVTDFYIAFLPYLDMANHVGWGYYSVPDFTQWYNANNLALIKHQYVVDTSVDTDILDFCLPHTADYYDSSVVVFNPIKTIFKASLTTGTAIRVSYSYRAPGSSTATTINSNIYSVSPDENGFIYFDFPGAVFINPPQGSGYYIAIVLGSADVKGNFTMLPLEYDSYQFGESTTSTYFQLQNTDTWNTVLMEFTPPLEIPFGVAEYYCQGNLGNIGINESKEGTELAYYYDVPEGSICYINGQENTSITAASLRGKRTTVAIVSDNGVTNTTKYIGCVSPGSASDGSNGSSTFKFYKFMAFKEKLTKEQINMVMDKYGFYKGE